MASTIIIYEGDGTKTDFTIPFDYLKKSFVTVRLGSGTTLTGGDYGDTGSDYYFLDKTTIRLKVAPASGESLTIRRYTSVTERVVTFKDASILKATDLDTSQLQAFHIAEEGRDILEDSLSINREGNWDAKNKRIVNLADPVNPQDALTKAYYDKDPQKVQANRDETEKFMQRAETAADNAKASEVSASKSEATAKASAGTAVFAADKTETLHANTQILHDKAVVSASNAKTSETNAKASEVASKKSEENAKQSEANSKVSEANAKQSEANAKASEESAKESADYVKETAGVVVPIAPEIKVVADNIEGVRTVAGLVDDFQTVIDSVETVTNLTTRAETAATNAASSASEASASKDLAAKSATTAAGHSTGAESWATKSGQYASAAKTSETNAKTSEIAASASASSATASATEATAQAERAKEYADQISSGQLQADWAETDTTAKSFIKNKPSITTHNVVLAELQEGTKTTFGHVTAEGIRGAIKKWAPVDVDISGKADKTEVALKADKTYVDTELAKKQPTGDYATNSALTMGLAGKANVSDIPDVSKYLPLSGGNLESGLSFRDLSTIDANTSPNYKGLEVCSAKTWEGGAALYLRNNEATGSRERGSWGIASKDTDGVDHLLQGIENNLYYEGAEVERSISTSTFSIPDGGSAVERRFSSSLMIITGKLTRSTGGSVTITFKTPFASNDYAVAVAYNVNNSMRITSAQKTSITFRSSSSDSTINFYFIIMGSWK